MKPNPWNDRGLALQLATLGVAIAFSSNARAEGLTFEKAFDVKNEPATIHYQAAFEANGKVHQLEVWRDGDRRLKRRTDDAAETYVTHKPGDAEFRMSILDKKKMIHTRIDRTNLYRIGNFTDWFDLGHGLKHPTGEYQLNSSSIPKGVPKSIGPCKWYDLTQQNQATHVCWSQSDRLPLLMLAEDGKVLWRVTSLDRKPIPEKTFAVHDEGYVRNNANQDIEPD